MARLNESTTSVESIESLKRRFVRQNRELARVNSMQSLRIRSLESEVSHLLTENVSLREQTIMLGQEIDRYEAAKLLHAGVHDIKSRLENKLVELNDLVMGLGALPRQFSKSYSERVGEESQKDSAQTSWDLRHNEAKPELNLAPEEDWRLPVIPEDRDFPRKGPESYELDYSIESTRSPPDPQFADDPIMSTRPRQDSLCLQSLNDDTEIHRIEGDPDTSESLFPPTLETRKKRKYTTTWTENHASIGSESIKPHNSPRGNQVIDKKQPIRPADENFEATSQNNFETCRPTTSKKCRRDESCGDLASRESIEVKNVARCDGPPQRKALKPKNDNLNLASSGRLESPTKGNHIQVPPLMGNENQNPQCVTPSESISPEGSIPTGERVPENYANYRDKREHKPTVTRRDSTNEEPNHPSLLASVSDRASTALLDPPSRPARRQRAVVSYAEPNLRDKMRRSNNELIAAVGNGQSRRASNSQDTKSDACSGVNDPVNSRASSRSLASNEAGLCSDRLSTHQTNSVSQKKRKISPSFDYKLTPGKYSTSDGPTDCSPIKRSPSYERLPKRMGITELKTHMKTPAFESIGGASRKLEDVPKTAQNTKKQTRRHSSNQRSSSRETRLQRDMVASGMESPTASSPAASFLTRLSPTDDLDEISVSLDTQTSPSGNPHNQTTASLEVGASHMKRAQRASARRRSMML